VSAHDRLRMSVNCVFSRLITQRSVVQIHPPQPTPPTTCAQPASTGSGAPTYSSTFLDLLPGPIRRWGLTVRRKTGRIRSRHPDSSDPQAGRASAHARGTWRSRREELKSRTPSPEGVVSRTESSQWKTTHSPVICLRRRPHPSSVSHFQPCAVGGAPGRARPISVSEIFCATVRTCLSSSPLRRPTSTPEAHSHGS